MFVLSLVSAFIVLLFNFSLFFLRIPSNYKADAKNIFHFQIPFMIFFCLNHFSSFLDFNNAVKIPIFRPEDFGRDLRKFWARLMLSSSLSVSLFVFLLNGTNYFLWLISVYNQSKRRESATYNFYLILNHSSPVLLLLI